MRVTNTAGGQRGYGHIRAHLDSNMLQHDLVALMEAHVLRVGQPEGGLGTHVRFKALGDTAVEPQHRLVGVYLSTACVEQ